MAKLENVFPGLCNDLHLTLPSDEHFFKLEDISFKKPKTGKTNQKGETNKKPNRTKNNQNPQQKHGTIKGLFSGLFPFFVQGTTNLSQ